MLERVLRPKTRHTLARHIGTMATAFSLVACGAVDDRSRIAATQAAPAPEWSETIVPLPVLGDIAQEYLDLAQKYGQGELVASRLGKLPVNYSSLEGNYFGVCYYKFSQSGAFIPVEIRIDSDKILKYYKRTTISPYVVAAIQYVLYHELAHCTLGVDHVPTSLLGTESLDGLPHKTRSLMHSITDHYDIVQALVPSVLDKVVAHVFDNKVVADYRFPLQPFAYSESFLISLFDRLQTVTTLDRYMIKNAPSLSLSGDDGVHFIH